MKTKLIEISKARIILCDIAESNKPYSVLNSGLKSFLWCKRTNLRGMITYDLPQGNWQLLGFLKDLTEEQKEMIVERIPVEEIPSPYNDMQGGLHFAWTDYENLGENGYSGFQGDSGCFGNVLDSFYSLLKANEIYLENPLGKKPHQQEERFITKPHNLCMTDVWKKSYKEWQEAEENVFGNPVVLIEPKTNSLTKY